MEVKISYRQLEAQPQIEERVQTKANKFKKFFNGKMFVDWKISQDAEMHHSDVSVKGDHFEVFAKATDANLFKSIDEVAEKIEKQIHKKNSLLKGR